jgi:hypothetical protein
MLQRQTHSPSRRSASTLAERAELKRLRDQRHRARLRAGRIVVAVELDAEIADMLVRLHWIDERLLTDRKAVAAAIAALLAEAAAR